MPNYIKPTLTVSANRNSAATNKGPLSVALNLSVTDSLSVDDVRSKIVVPPNSGAPTKILDGDAISGGDSYDTAGTHGGFLYFNNITSSGTDKIYIGTVLQGAAVPADMGDTGSTPGTHTALDNPDDASVRLMTLFPGEFAWLPWDYLQDIYVGASAASQSLEYWLFDRG